MEQNVAMTYFMMRQPRFCLSCGILEEITGRYCGCFWIGHKTAIFVFLLVVTGSEHSE
jgi:hypothetical protein